MTDEDLHDYSGDHLYYELFMLYETASCLHNDGEVHKTPVVKNALIDSFAIHARSLVHFLYPEMTNVNEDDVTSEHYVRDVPAWRMARGVLPSTLALVRNRTAKEIAHLTRKRHSSGDPRKEWDLEDIVRALCEPLHTFVAHAVKDRLSWGVTFFVANLPRRPVENTVRLLQARRATLWTSTSTHAETVSPPIIGSRGPVFPKRPFGK